MIDRSVELKKALTDPSNFLKAFKLPVQAFIHTEQTGALVLLLAAVVAMVWVNSPFSESYSDFWHTNVSFDIFVFSISEDLEHLVNDGLMAVFFFVVGLEIKRELMRGELSDFRRAVLPAAAAVGGMVAPALIYFAFNGTGEGSAGWGIPMATDIAFALGVLALLGRRLPAQLRVFLLGLAVVDDLGAIGVIAIFYTETINWSDLGLAIALFAGMAMMIRLGIQSMGFYVIVSILMWQFLLHSGVHATLAGVMMAAITPAEPYLRRQQYAETVEGLLARFKAAMGEGDEEKAETIVMSIERLSQGTEGPMERLERSVHPWTSFVILPLFALANAGIVLSSDALTAAMDSQVTLAILVALPVGNAIGIFSMTWLAVRSGLGQLPFGVSWWQILGVALLGGVGFTVSIFISNIAFDHDQLIDMAKLGVLGGSILSGCLGYVLLRLSGGPGPTRTYTP